jgi:hypothetical protein
MQGIRLRRNIEATAGLVPEDVVALTERATRATFDTDWLTDAQCAANRRIPRGHFERN